MYYAFFMSLYLIFTAPFSWAVLTHNSQKKHVVDELVASVNKEIIYKSDVDEYLKTIDLRKKLDPIFTESDLGKKGTLAQQKEVVDFLIENKIISQEFPTSNTEVEEKIREIEKNNQTTREALTEAIIQEGFTFAQYFKLIQNSISRSALIDREIRNKIIITEDDLKNFFYQHYSMNEKAPRSYHIFVMHFSIKNYKSPTAALVIAKETRESLTKGTNFEDLAKKFSDDESSIHGGDLGYLTEDSMSDEIISAVKKLKIGEISPVLTSINKEFYSILKLNDIQSDQKNRFDKVKDEIYIRLTSQELQRQIALWIERKKNTHFIHLQGSSSMQEIPILGEGRKK